MAKTLAHWLVSGAALVRCAIVGTALASGVGLRYHAAELEPRTFDLELAGGHSARGLTVGLKRGNVLLSLIVLPLAMPCSYSAPEPRPAFRYECRRALYLLAALCVLT